MEDKMIETIYELANKILENKIMPDKIDEQLLNEIITLGYGLDSNQNVIVPLHTKFFNYMVSQRDYVGCGTFLQIIAENIRHIQKKEDEWIKKSTAIIATSKKNEQRRKTVSIPIGELFAQQNRKVSAFAYNRLDTVVRYLAIENYYGKNDYGFFLYEKMQGARMGQDYVEYSVKKYRELIASFEKNGYDKESGVVCDVDFHLVDGSHRLALCLYHEIPEITVNLLPKRMHIEYGAEWFHDNGFTEEEIALICDKCVELMKRYIVPFTCILWPPVQDYFDEITQLLATAYEIVSYQDYDYSEETFMRLLRGVYHIDDIEEWKINKKLQYMKEHCPKKVRFIKIYFINADFRLKQINDNTVSKVGEYIKRVIRNEYEKRVNNYFYDIIIHTGDNYRQNEYISKLFEQAFSLRNYLEMIKEYPYILVKQDVPYQTMDFPNSYAFSKDLDILTLPEVYDELIALTIAYMQNNVNGYELIGLETEDNYRIRIELKGYLVFQIDISKSIEGLKDDFIREAIQSREKQDIYYVASKNRELCIRINEIIKNPQKQHHWDYIEKYKRYLNKEMVRSAFEERIGDIEEILFSL